VGRKSWIRGVFVREEGESTTTNITTEGSWKIRKSQALGKRWENKGTIG